MRRPAKTVNPPTLYLGSGLAPDGRVIELIRDDCDGLARLITLDTQSLRLCVEDGFSIGAVVYRPIDEPEQWIRAIRLPRLPPEAGGELPFNIEEDFEHLCSLFCSLGPDQAILLATWVLSTWRIEKSPMAPLLFVSGIHAESVLATLELVCRRSILLQSSSATGNYPGELQPTLIVSFSRCGMAQRFLGECPTPGRLTWKGKTLVNRYTARAAGYADEAKPLRGVLNIVADTPIDASGIDSNTLQVEFFSWRMGTWNKKLTVQDRASDPVLANLLVGVAPNEAMMTLVAEAYQRHLEPLNEEVASEEDEAIKAALTEIAKQERPSIRVGEIAERAEKRLRVTGSYLGMTPRRAGEILRLLGFSTVRLGASGRGLILNAENVARIKELVSSRSRQPSSVAAPDATAAGD